MMTPSPAEPDPAPTANDEPRSRIDKSVLALPEPKRVRDKQHLRFVAKQPCLVCGREPSDPHHLRFAQPRGLGQKVSDEFTVPLCRDHHSELHRHCNERGWWANLQIDAIKQAKEFWMATLRRGVAAIPSDLDSTPSANGAESNHALGRVNR